MHVVVTGATGFVGRKLCVRLLDLGHELTVIGRSAELEFRKNFSLPCDYLNWDNLKSLKNVDVLFHLAGASIAGGRWTEKRKKVILDSRVDTATHLASHFRASGNWPAVFVSASGVGYYGDRGEEVLDEQSLAGEGFLADVCKEWECASQDFVENSRALFLRIGVVLERGGGFLSEMEKIFEPGLGGVIGSGRQWMSWIHGKDLVEMMIFAMEHKELSGVINAVAPEPVTNREWTNEYVKHLKVSSFLPTPAIMLKLILGEMACLALGSLRVHPNAIARSGFKFTYENLEKALSDIYGWKNRANENLFVENQWVDKKREELFPFFSEAKNLEKITPPK